jgi:hypothetical protein
MQAGKEIAIKVDQTLTQGLGVVLCRPYFVRHVQILHT